MVDITSSSLFQSNISTILHWPLARKIELLSSFSQCSASLCLCAGWIKPNEVPIHDITTNDDTTVIRKPLLCCSCQHPFDLHYNEKTKAKYWSSESTIEQVDSALQTLLDADLLIRFATSPSLSDQHDLSTNRTLLFIAQTLQSTITTMAIHSSRRDLINTNMSNLLGVCPFEQPCIRDAVINCVCSTTPTAASTATNDNQQLHVIFEAGKQFLNLLNTWKMPSNVAHLLWLEEQPAASVENMRKVNNYELWYARWVGYCIVPQLCPKSLTKYEPTTIFGYEYLSLIFDHFKSDMLTTRTLSPSLIRFFDTFQQTLTESDSACWSSSYERPVIPMLEANIESLLTGDQINAPANSTNEQTEKKITRRVSKALTNKKQLKRLEPSRMITSTSSSSSPLSPSASPSPSQAQQQNASPLPGSEFINRVWSCVCERHEQRLRAEIEKTLFKANPKRDEVARLAEQRGFAEFHLIKHDLNKHGATETDLMYKRLLQLINVFSRALPKMPQNYIARTVLDPRHQSLIIVFASKVIGGICFRMFPHRNFSEIVFCAVSEYQQVRGYGTHLMNHLKDYHIRLNITNLLTYADGFAVGYFKKQGFSSTITLNEQAYTGYIKDYDGATLMQCSLYTQVTYTRLTETLSLIKESINVIRTHRFNQIKQAHPDAKFLANDIQTVDLSSYDSLLNLDHNETNSSDETVDINLLYITLKSVYQEIRSHPFASHVQKKSIFQDYLSTPPLFPIDLDTIQDRLKAKYYHNAYTFTADVSRLLDTAGRAYANQKKDISNEIRSYDTFVRRKMNEFGLEMGHAPQTYE
ncbi:unnamed protein product [Rotaria socialis]|uniref:N-acetyltransferase domain-containing protein n=3 Tax=Rotaria socialis TaxID=392032 RepID=A0A819ZQX7_9BILA|nr:unnamed protein product [Rotaria socialis]CAF3425116.1 unnamed protein product [Rotaria socialis]CAF3439490.1 unnamed protein product [Rotaria socialis]CAF3656018.1 unnamed protein product [Rotaria socialis]CAF4173702.1 unnamed protein product [Rotaria socialis]